VATCEVSGTRTSLSDRSFTATGPDLWNNLSLHLRDFELSLLEFRRLLKTHLFGWWSQRLVTYLDIMHFTNVLTYLIAMDTNMRFKKLTLSCGWASWLSRAPGHSLRPFPLLASLHNTGDTDTQRSLTKPIRYNDRLKSCIAAFQRLQLTSLGAVVGSTVGVLTVISSDSHSHWRRQLWVGHVPSRLTTINFFSVHFDMYKVWHRLYVDSCLL